MKDSLIGKIKRYLEQGRKFRRNRNTLKAKNIWLR